ncbi:MAG TPA: hypothetical protein VFI90_04655 [Rubrobacter sp.]|nr:hypothetical protein [Rubrobacter sp.]
MDTEGNLGRFLQLPEGMKRPGARDHQAAGADDTFLERADDSLVDGMAHPEIVGVDE